MYPACNGKIRRRRKRKNEQRKYLKKIITGNFPKFMIDIKPQVQESQRTLRKSTPMYIIFKLQKVKGKKSILKEARFGERPLVHRRERVRITLELHS